jgi:hypothetical protein
MHLHAAARRPTGDADAIILTDHHRMGPYSGKGYPVTGVKIQCLGERNGKFHAGAGWELVGIRGHTLHLETIGHDRFFQIGGDSCIFWIRAIHGVQQMNFTQVIRARTSTATSGLRC